MSIAIFYGSTTGNTEYAAEMISAEFGEHVTHMADVADSDPEDFLEYDLLVIGVPTWNIGEMQYDWEDFLPKLQELDLSGKKIAMFGLGDSLGYPENFLDALGLVWDELSDLGEPVLKGIWPTTGYTFEHSRGRRDDEHFLGLGLDEENESELHEERIKKWTAQVLKEFGLS